MAVRNQIGVVLTLLQRAETGQRGYLLTGRDLYLQPHDAALKALPAALDALGTLVADNPTQQQQVGRMRQLVGEKLRELSDTIEMRKAGNTQAALAVVNSDGGQRVMDDFLALVTTMEREEDRLLAQRQASASTFGTLVQTSVVLAFLLICAAGALGSVLTRRSFTELAAAHDQLVQYQRGAGRTGGATDGGRKPDAPDAEDGSHRAADRRHRARLQQHAGDRHGQRCDLLQRRLERGDYGIEPLHRRGDAGRPNAPRS